MQDMSLVKTDGRKKLESWLNRILKIEMTDGRTLIGKYIVHCNKCSHVFHADDLDFCIIHAS